MEEEFGACLPVRFLNPDQVKAYDSRGNEVEIPICEYCGYYKSEVIGSKHSAWICCNCVVECEIKNP